MAVLKLEEYDASYFDGAKQTMRYNAVYAKKETI